MSMAERTAEEGRFQCPKCGSFTVFPEVHDQSTEFQCRSCGHHWTKRLGSDSRATHEKHEKQERQKHKDQHRHPQSPHSGQQHQGKDAPQSLAQVLSPQWSSDEHPSVTLEKRYQSHFNTWQNWKTEYTNPPPFEAYVWYSYEENQQAIANRSNDPTDFRQWKTAVFVFTRWITAYPDLLGASDIDAAEKVEQIIGAWPRPKDHQNTDPWEYWFFYELDHKCSDPKVEFLDVWNRIEHIPGKGAVEMALIRATQSPLPVENAITDSYARFVSFAGWLQYLCQGKNIFLPLDLTAKTLNYDRTTISRYRQRAIEEGYLEEVNPFSSKKRLATEYRFNLKIFPKQFNNLLCKTEENGRR